MNQVLKQTRRLIVAVFGGTVLLLGLLMVVLPGPAILFVPMGLAILATEFVWAQSLLARMREKSKEVYTRINDRLHPPDSAV